MSLGAIGKNISAVNKIAATQPQVLQAIKQASAKTGVDFAYLVNKAGTESSFNPTAKAKTSSASGLYQFVKGTWLDMIDRHGEQYGLAREAAAIERGADGRLTVKDKGERERILALRNNPHIAAAMAAEYAAENAATLQRRVGGNVGATEMYLAHFLGSDGAASLLGAMKASPNTPAAALLPNAAAANRSVFYTDGGRARTVSEIYDRFATKFDAAPSGLPRVQEASVHTPSIKPESVKPVAPVKVKPVEVLAVITPENYSVAQADAALAKSMDKPMRVASAGSASVAPTSAGRIDPMADIKMMEIMAASSQFQAMQIAQQLLDSDGRLSQRQGRDRESASRLFG